MVRTDHCYTLTSSTKVHNLLPSFCKLSNLWHFSTCVAQVYRTDGNMTHYKGKQSTSASPYYIETDSSRAILRQQYQHLAGILCGTLKKRVELCFSFLFPILKTSYKTMGGQRAMPVSLPHVVKLIQKLPEGKALLVQQQVEGSLGRPRLSATLH